MATALVLVGAFGALGVRGALSVAHLAMGDGLGAEFVGVLLALTAVVLAIVMGVSMAQPLSGWALDGIVRAQERELDVAPAAKPPWLATMLGSLASALLGLAVGVPLIVVLTLAAWAFPPAVLITVPLKAVVAALLLAWDLLDYPLALHGVGVVARLKWCAHHFGAVLGGAAPVRRAWVRSTGAALWGRGCRPTRCRPPATRSIRTHRIDDPANSLDDTAQRSAFRRGRRAGNAATPLRRPR
jgi:hypothetical protein